MTETLPTIRIRSDRPKGYRIINLSDFDPTKHEAWTDGQEAKAVKAEAVEAQVSGEPSDDELRDAIETLIGTRPHHRTGRAKLVDMLREVRGDV